MDNRGQRSADRSRAAIERARREPCARWGMAGRLIILVSLSTCHYGDAPDSFVKEAQHLTASIGSTRVSIRPQWGPA